MPPKPKRPSNNTESKAPPDKALKPDTADVGALGEALVVQWLGDRGWLLIHQRWRCRWGELDLVVGQPSLQQPTQPITLSFVEVKTRSRGNWDSDGALAVTTQKQKKLWKAAQLFLATHPEWGDLPCQFDVALVCYKPLTPSHVLQPQRGLMELGSTQATAEMGGYSLTLQDYIAAAFTVD